MLNSIHLITVKYSWGTALAAGGSQVLGSLIVSSFATGDAGAPGNHRSEDFPAPSQNRPKWPISHHMIPPLRYSVIAKVIPFFSDFCMNWAFIPTVASQQAVVCILGWNILSECLCTTLNSFLFLLLVWPVSDSHAVAANCLFHFC